MRPSFHSRLINSPVDDPGLLIYFTHRREALLFDLGDLRGLSPNDLLKVERVFITHTHMDHFIGFDHLLRLLLGRARHLYLYGPRGFLANISGKLAGYTWNLVQNYSEALVLEAAEIDGEGRTRRIFDCRTGFAAGPARVELSQGDIVHQEPGYSIRTVELDHQIPCLAFCLEERFHVNILKARLEELGLAVGPWLSSFKELLFQGADPQTPVAAPAADRAQGDRHFTLGDLAGRIALVTRGQKVAYITDAAHTPENQEKMIRLAQGADHLFIEAAFLESDRDAARTKYHLTAYQAGRIARKAQVKQMTIFHHSPRYAGQAHLLEAEARAAFEGGPQPV